MKQKLVILLALGLLLPAMTWSQEENERPGRSGRRPPPREDGPGPAPREGRGGPGREDREGLQAKEGRRPPPPPLIAALDANDDGVIDATEISKASEALRKLDKNNDGQLTMDEIRPKPPGEGPRGQGGPGPREGRGGEEQERPPRRR